jgi:peptidyl-prolyl cis-trans isomerase SurA
MRALIFVIPLFVQMLMAMPVHAVATSFNDSIVAVVSTTVISGRELGQRVALTERQVGGADQLSAADKRFIENKSLMILIDEELQHQFATANGITVTPGDLEKYKAEIGKQIDLAKLGAGGLEGALKRKMEAEIRWQKVIAQVVRPTVTVSQYEVDQLIGEMLKGRHVTERDISQILLSVTDKSDEASQHQKIEQLLEKLKGGAKFEDLAKQYSDDKSAGEGGHMGWFASGELNPQLEDALDKLQPGQYSGIIRTPLGWHIIRLDNVRATKPLEANEDNMAEYRARVREHLTANRLELESRRLMREIRQKSFVDIRKNAN